MLLLNLKDYFFKFQKLDKSLHAFISFSKFTLYIYYIPGIVLSFEGEQNYRFLDYWD